MRSRELTPREVVVLANVAEGLTNQGVAGILNLSPQTVKAHLDHVYSKLDACNRSHAVALGFRMGVLK